MSYRNPKPTVDIIIQRNEQILLIYRKNEPIGWALPGGFVDEGESVEAAAIREAKEETGLDVCLSDLLYVYSDPNRDKRQHTMSVVFTATASGEAEAMDDAAKAVFFNPSDLPSPLVFDHLKIISDFIQFKQKGHRPKPSSFL